MDYKLFVDYLLFIAQDEVFNANDQDQDQDRKDQDRQG